VPARTQVRSSTKIRSKINFYPHRHFTEHLVGTFEKSPRESDLNMNPRVFCSGDSRIIPASSLQQSTHKLEDTNGGETNTLKPGQAACLSRTRNRSQMKALSRRSNSSEKACSGAKQNTCSPVRIQDRIRWWFPRIGAGQDKDEAPAC
jgi:hypothetical protein